MQLYFSNYVIATVSADVNNASSYDEDDASSSKLLQQMTSAVEGERRPLSSDTDSDEVTPWTDFVTTDVAAAASAGDDVMMTSLLCVGAAVCATSLAVLAFLAARRRLRPAVDKRVVVPVAAAQRLLAVAADGATTSAAEPVIRLDDCRQIRPPPLTTSTKLYADKWTASHVTAMRLLITGHQRNLWASSTDTCIV